ncbi:MAG: outer membrane protein assembly factor BamD [Deltaproteobacteria bacterium]|nr:outer membrane protein assembly factor BamD [Deltaproteobacteria bacterium]
MLPLRHNTFWIPLLLVYFLGCAGVPEKKEPRTDEEFFNKAMEFYIARDAWQGIPAFQEVRDKFPLSQYAVLSELRIADLHYFKAEYVESIHFYEEFKRLHPSNPHVPYTVLQLGMCYFKQIEVVDRDQTPAEEAASYFEYLIEHYPTSPFAGKAMVKLTICRQKIFEHDFYIGHFYYKTKKYMAAKERFLKILKHHTHVENKDKVLFYLALTYQQLNEETEARDMLLRLLENYPHSKHRTQAKLLLNIPLEPERKEELEKSKKKKRFIIF